MANDDQGDTNEKPIQPGTELSEEDPEYMEEGEDFDSQWAEGDTPEAGEEV